LQWLPSSAAGRQQSGAPDAQAPDRSTI